MINRVVLALLALLTGLTVPVGPADAHVARVEVRAFSALPAAKASRAPVALARLPEPGLRNTRRHAPLRVATAVPVIVPTIHTGIDRARE